MALNPDNSKLLKITLGIIVLGVIATIALIVIAFNNYKQRHNPDNIAKLAASMVVLPDPLPQGWKYSFLFQGIHDTVDVRHGDTKSGLQFVRFSKIQNPKNLSAKQMIEQLTKSTLHLVTYELDSEGDEIMGRQKAHYVRGLRRSAGIAQPIELALIQLNDGSFLEIEMIEDNLKTYEPSLVKPMIDAIEGIVQPATSNNK